MGLGFTCSLHCSSFRGLLHRILLIDLVEPQKGTTMATKGKPKPKPVRYSLSTWTAGERSSGDFGW